MGKIDTKQLLAIMELAAKGIALYRELRDAMPADAQGQLPTDADLIELFRVDAHQVVDHADQLLAKYRALPDLPPTP